MSTGQAVLLLTVLLPLACALASVFWRRRAWLLPLAPLPGLACAVLAPAGTAIALPRTLLGAALERDPLGAVFLGFCGLLWAGAGAYAWASLGGKPRERSFCVCWHLTLAGSLGVCVAADVASFYASFAALSLAAYVLVVHDRAAASLRAGRIYIALAIFGEIALLFGLLLAVQGADGIGLREVRASLGHGPWRDAAMALMLVGLGLKAGLVPLHGWLPLAHSAAPAPASAVLSGAIVKAGILGLLRFVPMESALPHWSLLLTWLGLVTAYAGVLLGLPQDKPKAVLAYSTMSQMGLLVAVLGAGIGAPAVGATQAAAAFYALHHGLAKGALFLAAGLLALGWRPRTMLAAAALLGAAMAGLPLTGGALAKLAVKGPLGEGWAATLAGLSAVGTMLLMLRFLWLAARTAKDAHVEAKGVKPPMPMAFGLLATAALLLPWWSFPRMVDMALAYAWSPATLWAAAWPIALALAAGWAASRRGLRGPSVPIGDIASWGDDALRRLPWAAWLRPSGHLPAAARARQAVRAGAARLAARCEAAAVRLAQWPLAATALLAMLAVLVLALYRPA